MEDRERRDTPAHRALGLIIEFSKMHRRVVERRLSGMGVHHSQHRLLMHLARIGKLPSQKELAAHFNVSPASVAVTLKKLAQNGYIDKVGCDEDNRRNEISITSAGMQIVSQSRDCFEQIEQAMFEGMTEQEVGALCDSLARLCRNLNQYEAELNARDASPKE